MRDLGGGQMRGRDLPEVPDFPEGNNPSGGEYDHPVMFDGEPVSPAVGRARLGAAHAAGHGQNGAGPGGGGGK
jgi:hypothetical protein